MLKLYRFGSKIINWIKILYKKPKCRVIIISGYFFDIKKGLRQGDHMSPTIFLLCTEYLAAMLRQSKDYQGFEIEHHCFKVSLFADDAVIYLNGSSSQFRCVFDILDYFGKESGCKVNLSKSYAFYIGSSRGKNLNLFRLEVYLGRLQ